MLPGYALSLVHNCPRGIGMEAIRVVVRRFEPRTPSANTLVLHAIITSPPSNRAEDTEIHIVEVEHLMKGYGVLAD